MQVGTGESKLLLFETFPSFSHEGFLEELALLKIGNNNYFIISHNYIFNIDNNIIIGNDYFIIIYIYITISHDNMIIGKTILVSFTTISSSLMII